MKGLDSDISQIYTISSFLVWLILIFCLPDTKTPLSYPYYGSWLLALIVEIGLFSLSLTSCRPSSPFDYVRLIVHVARLLTLNLLVAYLFASYSRAALGDQISADESAPLLSQKGQPDGVVNLSNTAYGSVAIETSSSDGADLEFEAEDRKKEEKRKQDIEDRLKADGDLFTYIRRFFIFVPYVWPSNSKDRKLQLNVLGVVVCLACVRALHVLIPHQLGVVINALGASRGHVPVLAISLYIFYSLASSSAGILSIKSW